jgi:hypothetical protein
MTFALFLIAIFGECAAVTGTSGECPCANFDFSSDTRFEGSSLAQ